jgi:hypothetical protein
MRYNDLENYYRLMFALIQFQKWPPDFVENMIPFEREIYVTLLQQHIEEEEENQILSEEKISEIKQILQELEKEKKFFQTQGYAIRDLAKDTGIPSYILTLYINRVLETNFSDFMD